jgi:hypothetical protein
MSLKYPLDGPEQHIDILTSGCNQFSIEGDCDTERIAGALEHSTYLLMCLRAPKLHNPAVRGGSNEGAILSAL